MIKLFISGLTCTVIIGLWAWALVYGGMVGYLMAVAKFG